MTARSPCWPRTGRASAWIRPTTWWCARTAASGSPTRATASSRTTRGCARTAKSAPAMSTASTPPVLPSSAWPMISSSPTTSPSPPTNVSVKPKGLAFSPDESLLYIADPGASHQQGGPRHIRRFEVGADGRSLRGGEVFAECTKGLFDGLRLDTEGRIWSSAGDGVHAYHPDGTLLGKILLPEPVANLCFGGPKRNRLFICATSSLYAITLNATGA